MNTIKYFIPSFALCAYMFASVFIMLFNGREGETMENDLFTAILIAGITGVVAIISSIIAFAASCKSSNNVTKLSQKDLSKEHGDLQGNISKENEKLQGVMSTGFGVIQAKVDFVERSLLLEQQRRSELSHAQANLNDTLTAFQNNWQSVIAENNQLRSTNATLVAENLKLNVQIEDLQKELRRSNAASDDNDEVIR